MNIDKIKLRKYSILNKNSSLVNAFKYSYLLLNKRERYSFKLNILLCFFAGLFEIISVTTFYPLVSFIIEPNLIETNKFINKIWTFFGNPGEVKYVMILSFCTLIILIFSIFLNLITQVMCVRMASSAEERLSKEIYNNLIYSSYKWHLLNNPNLSRNILLNNISIWNKGVIKVIPSMFGQLSGIIFAFILVISTTPKLGFILIILSISILYFFLKFIRKKSNKLMQKVRINQEIINIFITESLTGIKDIKLSSNEENFIKSFYKINHQIIKNLSSAVNWNSLPSFVVLLLGQVSILITATILFLLGIKGGELAAIMAVVVLVCSRVIPLFNKFGTSFTNITNYSTYIEKIYSVVDSIESQNDSNIFNNSSRSEINYQNWEKVIFSNIEFKYPNSQKPVIKNLNLVINKGLHYAFVGGSGAGKSTIIDLFLGLLEPTQGEILIDNIELRDIFIRDWQKNINYVPQDPLISDLSLRENIAFGIPKNLIEDEKILFCLKQTDLLKVANSLRDGIYTILGNKGISLSGGQKQRIAIARALYNNSDILVLDEATSSLDTKTEVTIQKTIQKLKNKMTIISIAHRFSTIRNCDHIFLMDKGKIKNSGTFEELKENSVLFRDLLSSQIL